MKVIKITFYEYFLRRNGHFQKLTFLEQCKSFRSYESQDEFYENFYGLFE